ncbi:hypothetical protein [Fructobacillus cardui]|uniref:hypothetical protein n=1 Tax=Fructobacillus cardui TaxID=2893170 RepID=UPI00200A525C|nr:hypothetical protein [Fructobacillus cardui]MCK8628014.1 hypothetical protein [Fructobacillus cardui]
MKKVVTIVVIFLVLVSGTFLVLRTSSSQSGHYVGKKFDTSSRNGRTLQDSDTMTSIGDQSSASAEIGSIANMISNLPSPNTNSTVPLSQQREELGRSHPVANGQEAIRMVQSLPGQNKNDSYQWVTDKLFGNSNENIFDVEVLSNSNETSEVYRVYKDGYYELLQPYAYANFAASADKVGQGSAVSNGQEAIDLISSIDYDSDHNYRLVYDPLFLASNPDIFDVQVLSKYYQALGKPGIEGVYRVYKDGHYEFLRP